jgi:uncharacterized protein (DUF3084 family)
MMPFDLADLALLETQALSPLERRLLDEVNRLRNADGDVRVLVDQKRQLMDTVESLEDEIGELQLEVENLNVVIRDLDAENARLRNPHPEYDE